MGEDYKKNFSAALRYLLDEKKWGSQTSLAHEVGKSQSCINKLANGKTSGKVDLLLAIAAAFGTTLEDMLALGRAITAGTAPADLPAIIGKKQAPTPASASDLEGYREHRDVIRHFTDKQKATKFNQTLVRLETLDPEKYDRLYRLAQGYLAQAEMKKEDESPPAKDKNRKSA